MTAPKKINRDNGFMLSQALCPLINLLRKVRRVKQHSDGTELERTKARLSNHINTEKQKDDDSRLSDTERLDAEDHGTT
jgi:hypothetical protein